MLIFYHYLNDNHQQNSEGKINRTENIGSTHKGEYAQMPHTISKYKEVNVYCRVVYFSI